MKEIVQLMMAGAGSLGFAILYNIRGKKLWVIAVGGIAAWGVVYILQHSSLLEMIMPAALQPVWH